MFDFGSFIAMEEMERHQRAMEEHRHTMELYQHLARLDQILFDEQLERNEEARRRAEEIINQI